MSKRPDLSPHQRKIVDRYYQHRDTIWTTRLSELASEIAIAQGEALAADRAGDKASRDASEKKLTRLWKSAGEYLVKCGASASAVERIAGSRDTARLARAAAAAMSGKTIV